MRITRFLHGLGTLVQALPLLLVLAVPGAARAQSAVSPMVPGMAVAAASPSGAMAVDPRYVLGSGDRLRITVFGERELSGQFLVDSSGGVAFPLLGEVHAAGLTQRQFEAALTRKLADGYLKSPRVSVEVLTNRPFYILGEVKNPGSYPYVSGMTVLNAVAVAGGFTYRAKTSEMYVTHGNDPTHAEHEVGPEAAIQPGDVIRVPERYF